MEENKIAKVSAAPTESLIQDLRQIIEYARSHVASTVNYALSIMYWKIGERINNEILENRRAEYGKQIVASVVRQLSWTHILQVLSLKDALQREFYLTLASSERWSVRRLRKEIDGMLFEHTAIALLPWSCPIKR